MGAPATDPTYLGKCLLSRSRVFELGIKSSRDVGVARGENKSDLDCTTCFVVVARTEGAAAAAAAVVEVSVTRRI